MKKENRENKKLSIYEYEEKYSSKENNEKAKKVFLVVVFALGAVLLTALFSLFKDVYDINVYAGYVVGGLELLAFVFFYVLPIVRIKRKQKFEINASVYSVEKAKKHNAKVRENLAEKIIDVYLNTDCNWYNSERTERLIKAKFNKSSQEIKDSLAEIYQTDVKKVGKEIIIKSAVKSGLYSAVSQKDYTDALLVATINLQMIKDLVFLYGFRPSDAKLVKIYSNVLKNSLVAYGMGNIKIGETVSKTIGGFVSGIPILGSAIATVVDGSVQGLANGMLTQVIGSQTVKYLMKEYNLQNVLDGVEIEPTEEEITITCEELKKALAENNKKKSA